MEHSRLRFFALILAIASVGGCARSVVLTQPAENPAGQRVVTQDSQGRIALEIDFHSRADASTFRAGLDNTDITSAFPASGNPRSALVPVSPGTHDLRLSAAMNSRGLFDSTGRNYSLIVYAAPTPPPPPSPSVDLTVNATGGPVAWGQAATFDLVLEGRAGFNGPVNLQVDQLPAGVTASYSPTAALSANNAVVSVPLSLATTLAGSPLGSHSFRVRASHGARSVNRTGTFTIRPSNGPFTKVTHLSASANCGSNVSASYGALGVNDIRTTFTVNQPGGSTSTLAIPSVYYAFAPAPACRAGIVMHPCSNAGCSGAGDPAFSWYNLGWPVATGAPAVPNRIGNLTRINWHQFWFSTDQSLLAMVTKKSQAVNCVPNCPYLDLRVFLYDAVTFRQLDQVDIRTRALGSIADPGADVTGVALSGSTVTVSFVRDNGSADTRTLNLP